MSVPAIVESNRGLDRMAQLAKPPSRWQRERSQGSPLKPRRRWSALRTSDTGQAASFFPLVLGTALVDSSSKSFRLRIMKWVAAGTAHKLHYKMSHETGMRFAAQVFLLCLPNR